MRVRIFGKSDCPVCKQMLKKFKLFFEHWQITDKVALRYHDIDTLDGLTEAAYSDALKIPAILIEDDQNKQIACWKGRAIASSEFGPYFKDIREDKQATMEGLWADG